MTIAKRTVREPRREGESIEDFNKRTDEWLEESRKAQARRLALRKAHLGHDRR